MATVHDTEVTRAGFSRTVDLLASDAATVTFDRDAFPVEWTVMPGEDASVTVEYSLSAAGDDWTPLLNPHTGDASPLKEDTQGVEPHPVARMRVTAGAGPAKLVVLANRGEVDISAS